MTKTLRLAICEMMRNYTRSRMSRNHLLGIMLTAQQERKPPPDDWIEQLAMLSQHPDSLAAIADAEEVISAVLEKVDEDALTQLILGTVKEDRPPN